MTPSLFLVSAWYIHYIYQTYIETHKTLKHGSMFFLFVSFLYMFKKSDTKNRTKPNTKVSMFYILLGERSECCVWVCGFVECVCWCVCAGWCFCNIIRLCKQNEVWMDLENTPCVLYSLSPCSYGCLYQIFAWGECT